MAKHTKQGIIEILRNLSESLNHKALTKKDIEKAIPSSSVRYHFGNIGSALEVAGLKRTRPGDNFRGQGNIYSEDELFESILKLEIELGHLPNNGEYNSSGKFSDRPFRKRYGKWSDVLTQYRKWKNEHAKPIETDCKPMKSSFQKNEISSVENNTEAVSVTPRTIDNKRKPPQLYGEPINFRGFQHAPINEQGVVFLFGMISQELGFNIEAVQQGFPDCEGKYLHDKKKKLWKKARIEFEYKASNFLQHGHDPDKCDFIVCWENDWLDCPLNVIELKTELLKLPSK